MERLVFEELDSTSTKAQELLREQKSPNFAVQSYIQRQGRGRRGRTWVSPRGNLYLTVVLGGPLGDHCDFCKREGARLSALRAAFIVARTMEELTDLRVTIKWPNDLYLFGSKLGGVLVESSVVRQVDRVHWGPLVIGIGLNLQHVPQGLDKAAALATWTRAQNLDPDFWGEALTLAFEKSWHLWHACELIEAMAPYLIGVGHPWLAFEKQPENSQNSDLGTERAKLYLTAPWVQDGSLTLEVRDSYGHLKNENQQINVSSSDHQYLWAYAHEEQKTSGSSRPLIVADIGNSNIKVGLFKPFDEEEPTEVLRGAHPEDLKFQEGLMNLRKILGVQTSLWPIHILSVHPERCKKFANFCEKIGFYPVLIQKKTSLLPSRQEAQYYPFKELGIDRMAQIEAFLHSMAPKYQDHPRLGVIVSFGTATTIDFVTTSRMHLGGVILPGLELALNSLHEATGLLPLVSPQVESLRPGLSTTTALAGGVVAMTLGAVKILRQSLDELRLFNGDPSEDICMMTGGLAPFVIPHAKEYQNLPHLTLSGARWMVLAGG